MRMRRPAGLLADAVRALSTKFRNYHRKKSHMVGTAAKRALLIIVFGLCASSALAGPVRIAWTPIPGITAVDIYCRSGDQVEIKRVANPARGEIVLEIADTGFEFVVLFIDDNNAYSAQPPWLPVNPANQLPAAEFTVDQVLPQAPECVAPDCEVVQ